MGYQLKTVYDNSNCWMNIIYILGLITLYILFISVVTSIFGFNKRPKTGDKVRCPYKNKYNQNMPLTLPFE